MKVSEKAMALLVAELSMGSGIETCNGTKALWGQLERAGLVAKMPHGGFLGHPFYYNITPAGRAAIRAAAAGGTTGPLIVKGKVAVDPARCPTLHRALTRMVEAADARGGWAKVAELRAQGDVEAAERAARRAMGIKGEPMDEETKAKLRAYEAEHKDEIAEKRKQKRELRSRTLQLLSAPRRRK